MAEFANQARREAYEHASHNYGARAGRIIELLEERGPMLTTELADLMGLDPTSIRPLITKMKDANPPLLKEIGIRKNKNNKSESVIALADFQRPKPVFGDTRFGR